MIFLFLFMIVICCVSLLAMYEWIGNIQRAACGFVGRRFSNTKKQFLKEIPLADDRGNRNTGKWILSVGRDNGYRCIPQWKLSKLVEDEKLNFILNSGCSISIRNSLGKWIGCYPPQEHRYGELLLRLEQKQLVIAAVRNWGLESYHTFCCEIVIYVYGDAAAPGQ